MDSSHSGIVRSAFRRPYRPADRPTAPEAWLPHAAEVKGTQLVFIGYLALVTVEYLGLANDIPVLKVSRFSTLMNYLLVLAILPRVRFGEVASTTQFRAMLGLLCMTGLGVFYADVQTYAASAFRPMAESIAFMVVTVYVLDRQSRLNTFMMLFGALAVTLVVRNIGKLVASSRTGAFVAPYFMGDGNDFAWALVVMLPIALALILGRSKAIIKWAGIAAAALCVLGVVGTQSRGGTLGLAAAALYGWWFVAKKRLVGAAAVVALALGVVMFAPSGYFSRMQTVAEYEGDNSAQARLQSWGAATRMALEHPLGVGAGNFNSAYGRHYNDLNGRVGWGAGRWISAHSIYFKVLGEYGFLGIGLLLCLIGVNLRDNVVTRRLLKASPEGAPIDDRWPAFLNMSIIGFAVAGAFLTGFNYPHIFLLSGLTLSIRRIVKLEYQGASETHAPASRFGAAQPATVRSARGTIVVPTAQRTSLPHNRRPVRPPHKLR
jgi:probable O-glycosylation ligase (exosortase A-associated)